MSERLREFLNFPQKRALQMLPPKGAADRGATSGPALRRETAQSKERHTRANERTLNRQGVMQHDFLYRRSSQCWNINLQASVVHQTSSIYN